MPLAFWYLLLDVYRYLNLNMSRKCLILSATCSSQSPIAQQLGPSFPVSPEHYSLISLSYTVSDLSASSMILPPNHAMISSTLYRSVKYLLCNPPPRLLVTTELASNQSAYFTSSSLPICCLFNNQYHLLKMSVYILYSDSLGLPTALRIQFKDLNVAGWRYMTSSVCSHQCSPPQHFACYWPSLVPWSSPCLEPLQGYWPLPEMLFFLILGSLHCRFLHSLQVECHLIRSPYHSYFTFNSPHPHTALSWFIFLSSIILSMLWLFVYSYLLPSWDCILHEDRSCTFHHCCTLDT